MKVETFQNLAVRVAATVGRNRDVQITFGGETAYTDGRHINIPTLPAGSDMTPHQFRVFSGYVDHETAHVRYSDMDAWQKWPELKDPVTHGICNIIEDIRSEKCQVGDYPGSLDYLDTLAEYVDKGSKVREKVKGKDTTKAAEFFAAFYKEAWEKYREVKHTIEAPDIYSIPELVPIADLMRKIPKLRSANDSYNLALEVKKLLSDEVKRQAAQKMSGQGPGQQMFGIAIPGQPGQGQPMPFNGKILTLGDLVEAAKEMLKSTDRAEKFKSLMEELKQRSEKDDVKPDRATRSWGKKVLPPADTSQDKIFTPSEENQASYLRTKASMTAMINALKKMTRVYLQTRTHSAWTRGLSEGTLDKKALHKLKVGSRDVYKELRVKEMVDTAVLLLIDLSSSMNAQMVRTTTIAIAEATAPVKKLSLAIAGFYGSTPRLYSRGGKAGRSCTLYIPLFKGFDEQYVKAQARLGAIGTGGSTPLGCAYGSAYEYIVNRKEKRRVIWVISDGDPYITTESDEHNEFMQMERVHRRCKKMGVETLGLGISSYGGQLNLKKYVDTYGEITDQNQLTDEVLKAMKGLVR